MINSQSFSSIIDTAHDIVATCAAYGPPHIPVRLSGREPRMEIPSDDWLLPAEICTTIDAHIRDRVLIEARASIAACRNSMGSLCLATLQKQLSVQGFASDAGIEEGTCKIVEHLFHRFLLQLRCRLQQYVEGANAPSRVCDSRKSSGFSPQAVTVLEAAYARSTTLTARECTLVAEAAGITHQQVRTWFQNKRNRKRTGDRRTASTSVLDAPVSDQVIPDRRIVSLPRRARATSGLEEEDAPRAIKGLPRRFKQTQVSPTPAYSPDSTISSLDSIPPSGGFLSPLDGETVQPTITFPTEAETEFEPIHQWLGDNVSQSPMELVGAVPWHAAGWQEDFGDMIQKVLENPTLADSPAFSSPIDGTQESPSSEEQVKMGLDGLEGVEGDELLVLLDTLLEPKVEGMAEISNEVDVGNLATDSIMADSGRSSPSMAGTTQSEPAFAPVTVFPPQSQRQAQPQPAEPAYDSTQYTSPEVYTQQPPIYPVAQPQAYPHPQEYFVVVPAPQPYQQPAWIPGVLPFDSGYPAYYPQQEWGQPMFGRHMEVPAGETMGGMAWA